MSNKKTNFPRIKGKPSGEVEDAKRFSLPGVTLEDKCPDCGNTVTIDFENRYLSYPLMNAVTSITCYCTNEIDGEECGNEWEVPVKLEVRLRLAKHDDT